MENSVFLFDVDGVVIRANGYFSKSFCEMHNLPADFFDTFFREDFPLALVGEADAREHMAVRLSGTVFGGRTGEVFDAWFEYNSAVNGEVLDFADRLRQAGHPVALATNQEKHRIAYLLNELGLTEFFEVAYPSCEIGAKKPEPTYFERVEARVRERWNPDRIILIDDQSEIIAAAEAAGWHGYRFDQNVPDAVEQLEHAFTQYIPDAHG
ncbi:MAG TPA: HAD-IA family hydrolase [bacterium]|nr:HAD-IA family hydrolase [bacterium]